MAGQDGLGKGVAANQPLSDGNVVHPARRWSREWVFLIWTWTIDWSRDYWLVTTVQHRFLGEETVHRYSRLYWQIGIWGVAVSSVLMLVSYGYLVSVAYADTEVDYSFLAFIGLVVLLMVVLSFTVVYFTYVPPKEYRSDRGE